MLSNMGNWFYVIITTFCIGYAFSQLVKKVLSLTFRRADSILMTGLVIATVYAEIWSLFGGVGLAANGVLVVLCMAIVLRWHKELQKDLSSICARISITRWVVIAGLFLLWSYFASRGYMAYDSDLYHGQSIRWIEEYGVVKGLGNLHERFAYNSSFFALSALYSMKFMLGQSLHTLNGYWAFLLSVTTLDIAESWKRRKMILSDYARVAAIYYLTTICDEVVAPTSDFAIMCMIFWIVIKWLDMLEREKEYNDVSETEGNGIAPYALLCVAGVYALTLKLTAGLILLLLLKPAYLLIREKRGKEIVIYLLLGVLVAVPWFARTVLISGYLVYPLETLDLFSFDWKMHPQVVAVDAANIETWARGLYQTALVDVPITQWMPNWFRTQLTGTEKLLILADVAGILLTFCYAISVFVKKNWQKLDYLLVMVTVLSSYLFWQFSAPMVRYGYAYILFGAALPFGYLMMAIGKDRIWYAGLLLYGIYKLWMVGDYAWEMRTDGYYVRQEEYGIYELEPYEVEGITFYYNPNGDRTGYAPFPAGPSQANITLRGEGLQDGFRFR